MEITDEELKTDSFDPAEDVLQEACPIPPEDYIREFEQYLLDIGLRF